MQVNMSVALFYRDFPITMCKVHKESTPECVAWLEEDLAVKLKDGGIFLSNVLVFVSFQGQKTSFASARQ